MSTTSTPQPKPTYHHRLFAGNPTPLLIFESLPTPSTSTTSSPPPPPPPPQTPAHFEDVKWVFYMIPGNPGIPEYYESFLRELWILFEGRCVCVCVGHPGHSRPSVRKDAVAVVGGGGVFSKDARGVENDLRRELERQREEMVGRLPERVLGLEEQVRNKVAVLDYLLDRYPNAQVVMAGHSIGSYMATEVLKARPHPHHRLHTIINLFPTLHHIVRTPRGRSLNPLFHFPLRHLALLLIFLLRLPFLLFPFLPSTWWTSLVSFLSGIPSKDQAHATAHHLLHPSTLSHALQLAKDEMKKVKEMDLKTLKREQRRLIFYYSKVDTWAPPQHYELVKRELGGREGEARVYMCEMDVPHGFVIGYSDVMAKKVFEWMGEEILFL
ncbi:hypothetical protein HDV05_002117 [Chytridiales sp. JEL 0842]|nr:hypothetical protein HDV05_002117 [Chytridiales sp. JEL 0842]